MISLNGRRCLKYGMNKGRRYGTRRVFEPKETLLQLVQKPDDNMSICDNEVLIDVITQNIELTSYMVKIYIL